MNRKKILQKKLARLQKKKDALKQRALASQDANEVRSIMMSSQNSTMKLLKLRKRLTRSMQIPATMMPMTMIPVKMNREACRQPVLKL